MNARSPFRLIRTLSAIVLVFTAVGFAQPAMAQYQGDTTDVRIEQDENEYQIVGRFRTVGVPNFLLNAFYDEHSANWRDGNTNFAYGLEFVWRKVGAFEMSVAAEYADLTMPEDFWLEAGKSADNADWVQFELGLASLVFSGYWYWDVAKWFAPYVGGGLGLSLVLGDVTKFNPRDGSSCRNNLGAPGTGFGGDQCFDSSGNPDLENQFEDPEIEDEVWPVAPMVNVTTGMRFNIREHGVVKLEFGFYDYLYAGLSGGVQW